MTTVTIGSNTGDTGGSTAVKIKEQNPGANYAGMDLEVFQWDVGDTGNSLLKFDLSSITGPVTVTAATLTMIVDGGGGGTVPSYQVGLYGLLRDWVYMDTSWLGWNTNANLWTVPGAYGAGTDADGSSSSDQLVPDPTGDTPVVWSGAGLASLVQAWINGTRSNYGVLMYRNDIPYPPTGPVQQSRVFVQPAGADGSRPALTITYSAASTFNPAWAGPGTQLI